MVLHVSADVLILNIIEEYIIWLLIHHDPCVPDCCSSCSMPDCAERKHAFQARVDFDPQQVVESAPYAVE